MKKKHYLKSVSLIEHLMRTLDRISLSLYISKALYLFSYKNLSLFKAKLKEYFCPSFPKKENPFEYVSYAHLFQIKRHTFKYRLLFPSNHSLTNFCILP